MNKQVSMWATNNYNGEASYNMCFFKHPVWSCNNKMLTVRAGSRDLNKGGSWSHPYPLPHK